MLKWIRFWIRKITEEQILKLIKELLGKLPVKDIIDLICDWLMKQAKKTENQVDDELVEGFRDILYAAFGLSDERIE